MVRHDGFRLSGFANPDPNYFARSLPVVFCVIAANVLEKPTKVVGLSLLVIFIAVLMTVKNHPYFTIGRGGYIVLARFLVNAIGYFICSLALITFSVVLPGAFVSERSYGSSFIW